MKKLSIIIFLLSLAVMFAQENNPNVELPDFVILGRDVVSVRKVNKIEPDFISTGSKDFLKPEYKPDQLRVADFSSPVGTDLSLLDSANFRRGFLELKAGRYQLPAGELNYSFPFTRGMLHGIIKGLNQTAYVDNSDIQFIQGSLDFIYSLPTYINTLPGTKFSISGDHTNNYFKFFGSNDPGRKRTLNIGNAEIGVQNLYMKQFIFDIKAGGDFTYLDDDKFNEALVYSSAFAKLNLSDFALELKSIYQNQKLTTDSLTDKTSDYYLLRPMASFEILDKFMIGAGFTFSGSSGEYLNNIYASFGAELTKNLVLLAEYSPHGEYITSGKLMRKNFYFNQQNIPRIFFQKKNYLIATLKYEYDKYYQIDGGVEYFSTDNIPYYTNPNQNGFFEVSTGNATNYKLFLNLLYHLGPYGFLYSSINFLNLEDSDSKKIPYYASFEGSLSYGYYFTKEWKAEAKLKYLGERFADIVNERKLDGFFQFGLKVDYNIDSSLRLFVELHNLLNTKQYFWEGYEEKPFDISAGVNFFFD